MSGCILPGMTISKILLTVNTFTLLSVTDNNISVLWTVCFGVVGTSGHVYFGFLSFLVWLILCTYILTGSMVPHLFWPLYLFFRVCS